MPLDKDAATTLRSACGRGRISAAMRTGLARH
jgi:hypothetical protein